MCAHGAKSPFPMSIDLFGPWKLGMEKWFWALSMENGNGNWEWSFNFNIRWANQSAPCNKIETHSQFPLRKI